MHRWKSKIGMALAGFYLLIALGAMIWMAIDPPRSWASIFPFILALPWIIVLPDPSALPIPDAVLWAFYFLLNALTLYLIGFSLTLLLRWVGKLSQR